MFSRAIDSMSRKTVALLGKIFYNFTSGTACPAGMIANKGDVCFSLLLKYFLGLFGLAKMMIIA
jgi:hypothetical protein